MRALRNLALAALLALTALAARPAAALVLPLTVSGGGIDLSRTCTTASCGTAIWTDTNLWAASGTVSIDTVGLTLTLAISVPTFTIGGAVDNGVTSLTLTNTTYNATVPISISGPIGGLTTYTIGAAQTAVVDPASVSEVGGGVTDPIFGTTRVTGSCGLLADNTGQCGFTFGGTGLVMPAPLSRALRQTMNLAVVPEPGTALLVVSGLLGIAWASRRPE